MLIYLPIAEVSVNAFLLLGLGGLIGVLLGLSLAGALSSAGMNIAINAMPSVLAFTCAFFTGLVFGYLPARKAAQLDPVVALACIGGDFPDLGELGTSVVPLYGRHPVGLGQLVRTAQSALDGRFTLGVGAASRRHVEGVLGLKWDKPFSYTV